MASQPGNKHTDKHPDSPSGKPPGWRAKLRAWWEGDAAGADDMADAQPYAAEAEPPPSDPEDTEPTIASWPPRRLAVAQTLFGEGFDKPGGEALIRQLTQPLGLNPNHSITELGCGMGAMTRLLAREGMWVDAWDSDAALVDTGLGLARKEGLKQRTNIRVSSLDDIQFKRRSIDAVLSKEGLIGVQDKRLLLAKLRGALRPGGQLMFTDFLLTGSEESRVYEVWLEREPVKPHLLTLEGLQAELESLNYTVMFLEDVSQEYKAALLDAFSAYAAQIKLQGANADPIERDWAISEGEHWAIRLSAMDAGCIRLYRCFCRVND